MKKYVFGGVHFLLTGLFTSFFMTEVTWSEGVLEAKKAQDEAYHTFYQTLKKQGLPPSAEKMTQLQNQILVPAASKLSYQINQSISQLQQTVRETVATELEKRFSKEAIPSSVRHPQFIQTEKTSTRSPSPSPMTPSKVAPRPTPHRILEEKENLILEGSEIPKEIEFPKKNNVDSPKI